MIPDEVEPIDFVWFYFIGRTKLGLTFKETGRLTFKLFSQLYEQYKKVWSFEMQLFRSGTTYEQARREAEEIDDNF